MGVRVTVRVRVRVKVSSKRGDGDQQTHLVDQRKFHSEGVGDGSGTFCASGIRGNDDGVLEVRDIVADVALQQRTAIQIVDRDIKEALILRIVEVHSDDMISTRTRQQVRDQRASLRNPLLIPGVLWRGPLGARTRRLAASSPPGETQAVRAVCRVAAPQRVLAATRRRT